MCLALRKHPLMQTYALLLTTILTGCTLVAITEKNLAIHFPGNEMQYEGVVASEPVERGRIMRFDMLVTSGPLCGRTVTTSLLKDTINCRYLSLKAGSGIIARSVIEPPANFEKSDFDYVTYLKSRGITARTFIYHSNWRISAVSLRRLSFFQRARISFLSRRHRLIEHYRNLGLNEHAFAVTAAMTLGHRSEISADLRSAYSAAGVSHVLALSGMHLSIIYMLLSMFLLGRRFAVLRESLLIVAIWTYVFMVGMPVSVVRAAIMLTVYSFVGLTGRDRTSLNILAFAAILILMFNPFSLYDVGFQLSFLSVAAILIACRTVAPIVSRRFLLRHSIVARLWHLVVMSCAAQLATAPLVIYYFGTVSLYFLPANLVTVPAVTIIIYLTLATIAVSFCPDAMFFPAIRNFLVTALSFMTTALNDFLLWLSSLPGAAITGIRINIVQLISIYIIITAIILLCRIIYRRLVYRNFRTQCRVY